MAQESSFSGTSVRAGVGSVLGAASIMLAGCGPQGEPPKALSDVQRQVCKDESIHTANDILSGRRQNAGPGFVQKIFPPKGTPTEQDLYLILQQKEQAKCEQETRDGLRKHSEDKGTTYPAFGTAGQAEPAAPVAAPAASAPEVVAAPAPAPVVVAVPVPVAPKALPRDAGVMANEGERIEPPVPAASAPAAGASAPEAAASAAAGPRSPMDYLKYGKRGNPASAPEGQGR